MNPPLTLRRITTPLLRLSPETMAEAKAAKERIAEQERRQRAADHAAEQHSETRTFKGRHNNFHE